MITNSDIVTAPYFESETLSYRQCVENSSPNAAKTILTLYVQKRIKTTLRGRGSAAHQKPTYYQQNVTRVSKLVLFIDCTYYKNGKERMQANVAIRLSTKKSLHNTVPGTVNCSLALL